MKHIIRDISAELPVLIAGPTASGKSALALEIAAASGGVIVNADALQVYANWSILTARPSPSEQAQAEHALYGHVPGDAQYSVGLWLRDLTPFLGTDKRLIIVGGTGLNFSALTRGLAEIPPTAPKHRAAGEALLQDHGLGAMLAELDAETKAQIDTHNPARVARAWEVLQSTGRGLASWQADTAPPLLALENARALVLNSDRDWLRERIARRFEQMLGAGALEEARANLPNWDPGAPSSKAIGARDLIAHLKGGISLDQAASQAIIASQQYAKRQRSWFRSQMQDWQQVELP